MSSSNRRTRRTPEQVVTDLEAQLEAARARVEAEDLKSKPNYKPTRMGIGWIDKAIYVTTDEEELADLQAAREKLGKVVPLDSIRPYRPRKRKANGSAEDAEVEAEGEDGDEGGLFGEPEGDAA